MMAPMIAKLHRTHALQGPWSDPMTISDDAILPQRVGGESIWGQF